MPRAGLRSRSANDRKTCSGSGPGPFRRRGGGHGRWWSRRRPVPGPPARRRRLQRARRPPVAASREGSGTWERGPASGFRPGASARRSEPEPTSFRTTCRGGAPREEYGPTPSGSGLTGGHSHRARDPGPTSTPVIHEVTAVRRRISYRRWDLSSSSGNARRQANLDLRVQGTRQTLQNRQRGDGPPCLEPRHGRLCHARRTSRSF